MIRIIGSHDVSGGCKYFEFAGLSTDEKPYTAGQYYDIVNGEKVTKTLEVATGSVFIEVDTGNVFFFNEAEPEWILIEGGYNGGNDPSPNEISDVS